MMFMRGALRRFAVAVAVANRRICECNAGGKTTSANLRPKVAMKTYIGGKDVSCPETIYKTLTTVAFRFVQLLNASSGNCRRNGVWGPPVN